MATEYTARDKRAWAFTLASPFLLAALALWNPLAAEASSSLEFTVGSDSHCTLFEDARGIERDVCPGQAVDAYTDSGGTLYVPLGIGRWASCETYTQAGHLYDSDYVTHADRYYGRTGAVCTFW